MARDLRLGLNVGYWAGGPPPGAAESIAEAERLGYDSLWTAERERTIRFDAVQPRYNLLFREIEAELLPAAAAHGVGAVVFNPLAAGMLTGKYKRGEAPREGTRFALGTAASLYQQRYWQDATLTGGAAAEGSAAAKTPAAGVLPNRRPGPVNGSDPILWGGWPQVEVSSITSRTGGMVILCGRRFLSQKGNLGFLAAGRATV